MTSKNLGNIQRSIEGEWSEDRFKFESLGVRVVVREVATGKVLSTFEGRVDEQYNPIMIT